MHGRLEMDNSAALCRAMYDGLGVGLTPLCQLRKSVDGGHLVPVLDGWTLAEIPLYALVPAGRQRLPRVRVVLDWLEDYLQALS